MILKEREYFSKFSDKNTIMNNQRNFGLMPRRIIINFWSQDYAQGEHEYHHNMKEVICVKPQNHNAYHNGKFYGFILYLTRTCGFVGFVSGFKLVKLQKIKQNSFILNLNCDNKFQNLNNVWRLNLSLI